MINPESVKAYEGTHDIHRLILIVRSKTKGPDVITVQPATLGRLALGRK